MLACFRSAVFCHWKVRGHGRQSLVTCCNDVRSAVVCNEQLQHSWCCRRRSVHVLFSWLILGFSSPHLCGGTDAPLSIPVWHNSTHIRCITLSLSLCFIGHFPDGSGLAGTRISPFWTLMKHGDGGDGDNWSCKMCKAPANLSPSTNQHPFFDRSDALPFA